MSSTDIAVGRLTEERKNWRKEHPDDFYARPVTKADNSTDLRHWETGIPGKKGTDWEGGVFKVHLYFPEGYPANPPMCKFQPVIFHPNVFSDGTICLSIIGDGWRPSITVKDIVLGIQELLDTPNPLSPANGKANEKLIRHPNEYKKLIKAQTMKHSPDND